MSNGEIVFIARHDITGAIGGYYLVSGIVSGTQVTLTNLGIQTGATPNVAPGNSVTATSIITSAGPNALRMTQAGTPLANDPHQTLDVVLANSGTLFQDVGNGIARLSIPTPGILAQSQGVTLPGTIYRPVNFTGGLTATDASGTAVVTDVVTLTSGFSQPLGGQNVLVNVTSTGLFTAGQYLFIPGGGIYIVQIVVNGTQVQLTNTADPRNAGPGNAIANGSIVAVMGPGIPGAIAQLVGAASTVAYGGGTLTTYQNWTSSTSLGFMAANVGSSSIICGAAGSYLLKFAITISHNFAGSVNFQFAFTNNGALLTPGLSIDVPQNTEASFAMELLIPTTNTADTIGVKTVTSQTVTTTNWGTLIAQRVA